MTFDRETERLTAGVRYGLGASAADIDAMGSDPRGWLLDQIEVTALLARSASGALPKTGKIYRVDAEALGPEDARLAVQQVRKQISSNFSAAGLDGVAEAVTTTLPFRERLIRFWNNHFAVGTKNRKGKATLPALTDDAIAPFVFAPFEEMLLAVSRHPSMQLYLDNIRSIGPNSEVGLSKGRGLNENLAREILELHTLGVDGGYTQADIKELAAALTGWSTGNTTEYATGWHFVFYPEYHEPGGATVLGKTYSEGGEETAEQILRDLARHPSTARHIAMKLARHFVDDDPPESAIRKLERRWLETDGDLAEVSRTLAGLDEARASLFSKLKQPGDLVVSALRALDLDMTPRLAELAVAFQGAMGQPVMRPPGPQGWYDTAADWSDPGSLARRVDWAVALAAEAGDKVDAQAAMERNFASLAPRDTRIAIERAASRQEAAAILVASPLFQRR
ncbi:MAG: DUF1800 domain-containing protein [Parvibaculum sp.]|nr:DUF1800 domain-containing protein [Parvibaculum sp.]